MVSTINVLSTYGNDLRRVRETTLSVTNTDVSGSFAYEVPQGTVKYHPVTTCGVPYQGVHGETSRPSHMVGMDVVVYQHIQTSSNDPDKVPLDSLFLCMHNSCAATAKPDS